ncbi:unnamed protein product [Schistosoma rodhaini]|nr:unnamed protein product [Schistosoma rodhaini]
MNFDRLITNEKSQFQETLHEMNNTAFNESASIEEYFNCITRVIKLQIIDETNTRELIEKGTENCRKPNATNEEEINKQTRLLSSLFYNVYKLNVNLCVNY